MKARHVSMLLALATAGEATIKWTIALWVSFIINFAVFIFAFAWDEKYPMGQPGTTAIFFLLWFLIGLPVGTLWLARSAMK